MSLLQYEAYQWLLTVEEGTQPKCITWDFFKNAFQSKYMGVSYMEAHRCEFFSLTQGDRTMAQYEVEFLRLSKYANSLISNDY